MKQIAKISAFLLLTALPAAADFDTETLPGELARRTQEFLRAETAAARSGMAKFSDDELQKITTAFKKSHNREEQRLFWLSEELYRRNAERVSAERIRYLYFAVLAALGLITAFSFFTFRQANRQRRAHIPMNDFPAAVPMPQHALKKPQPKRRAAKKKPGGK
ncbi:MAG: hypothetical protein ACOY5B_12885 [Spirochaetota bacterium]